MNNNKVITEQFCNRLKSVISKGVSGRDVANKASISYSTFHNYMSGTSVPTLENLVLLSRALNVSIEWLATGESSPNLSLPNSVLEIPYIDKEEFLFIDKTLLLNLDASQLFALKIETDAMTPTLNKNSIAIIKQITTLSENKLIVLSQKENTLIRRVQLDKAGYNLICDNKIYPNQYITNNDLSLFDSIYEVVLIIKRFS